MYIFAAYDYYTNKLIVQVVDCGQGLTEQKLRTLRKLFNAPARKAKTDEYDDGSNLYICKKILDMTGGKMEVHSTGVDQGTIF